MQTGTQDLYAPVSRRGRVTVISNAVVTATATVVVTTLAIGEKRGWILKGKRGLDAAAAAAAAAAATVVVSVAIAIETLIIIPTVFVTIIITEKIRWKLVPDAVVAVAFVLRSWVSQTRFGFQIAFMKPAVWVGVGCCGRLWVCSHGCLPGLCLLLLLLSYGTCLFIPTVV